MNGMEIVLPNILKQYSTLDLPDREDYQFYLDLNQRVFYVEGVIDDVNIETGYSSISELIKRIIAINIEDMGKPIKERKPIIIAINSIGGSLDMGFALGDAIRCSTTPCICLGIGDVMSAAFIVFISAQKRLLLPHAQLLTHQGSVSIEGGASEAQSMMANYKKVLSRMKSYILENTGIDEKTFNSHRKGDWYISADEAVNKYGIADKIITNIEDIFEI